MKKKCATVDEKLRKKVDGFKLNDPNSGSTSKYITIDMGTFYPPDENLNKSDENTKNE
ncbi:MAG: hypothetical protein Q8930_00945 [Bacillota bacterium]|nr:hypothetical protein [Bacillota bacterium]